jgi:hypothetical protein
VARRLETVTQFGSLGGDDMLVVEAGRRVRVIGSGRLLPEPGLMLNDATTISGVAVHPDYGRNGFVYLSEIEATAGSEHTVRIVRYRAVDRTLGEAAVIVSDIPVASADVRIALAPDLNLYVAMPATRDASRARGPYDGYVLRFDQGGAVPRDARGGSPVFSHGYSQPTALSAGGASELWLAGTGGAVPGTLARVNGRQNEWPRTPTPLRGDAMTTPGTHASALSLLTGRPAQPMTILFVSEPEGILQRALLSGMGRDSIQHAPDRLSGQSFRATALGSAANGVIYLAVADPARADGTDIIRLVPEE